MAFHAPVVEKGAFNRRPIALQPGPDELFAADQMQLSDIARVVLQQILVVLHLTWDVDRSMRLICDRLNQRHHARGRRINVALRDPMLPGPARVAGQEQTSRQAVGRA